MSSPEVASGAVYFGTDDGIFYAVDAQTGQKLWRFVAEEDGRIESSPSFVGSVVYFVSGAHDNWFDNKLHALDIKNGQEIWRIHVPSSEYCIIEDVFYIAGEFDGIHALDLNTGKGLWQFENESEYCSTPVVADGVVYFGCEDGYLYAVE
jgi:outer membrane protein assembly factor BamB